MARVCAYLVTAVLRAHHRRTVAPLRQQTLPFVPTTATGTVYATRLALCASVKGTTVAKIAVASVQTLVDALGTVRALMMDICASVLLVTVVTIAPSHAPAMSRPQVKLATATVCVANLATLLFLSARALRATS